MPNLSILSKSEILEFEHPPVLQDIEREEIFIKSFNMKREFKNDQGKLFYYLLRGYFISTGRFFSMKKFREDDVNFVCSKLQIDIRNANNLKIPRSTINLYRDQILTERGFHSYTNHQELIVNEANRLVKTSLRPKQILAELIDVLRQRKIEIPTYNYFATCITKSLIEFESELNSKINSLLSSEDKNELENILHLPKDPNKPISPTNPYLLTTFKKPDQRLSPGKIKESVGDFEMVNDIYSRFDHVLGKLDISDSLINYYAIWLTKSSHVTLLAISEPSKKFIYLLAFISYQYRLRQDYFADTLIKSVHEFVNKVKRKAANDFLDARPATLQQTKKIVKFVKSLNSQIETMRQVVYSSTFDDSRKVEELKAVFNEMHLSKADRQKQNEQLEKEIQSLENSLSSGLRESFIINGYVSSHRKLMNRVGNIIRVLDFNPETSDSAFVKAIDSFRPKQIHKRKKWPVQHLNNKQIKWLEEVDEKSYTKLYDVFLAIEVADKLNSGALNLRNSERYRAIEEYLISDKEWSKNKELLLAEAELNVDVNFSSHINNLKNQLYYQYLKTNNNLKDNKYLHIIGDGKFRVTTPKKEDEDLANERMSELLEKDQLVSLVQVLKDVQSSVNYLSLFTHFNKKHFKREQPSETLFIAAIIALGCNFGLRRLAKISHGISYTKLNDLVQWYFTKDNIDSASSAINLAVEKLSLPSIYQSEPGKHHTSSDGQKFNVDIPLLISSYSPKYYGTGKGVTALSFIDDFSRLYYNLIMDPSVRESTYTIDGLINDSNVTSDKHSTDTHGYTEIVFGLSYGLGVEFSPRIKNINKQMIYTFRSHPKKDYLNMGFGILPTATTYINEDLIEKHWDKILRILVTIKLRINKASNILKRLTDYSKQHELHKALKEFGRIYKSTFILKYIDDLEVRRSTVKAENRIEQSHQFAKAVLVGGNLKLNYSTKEEQELALACRHLIQNAIVLWNYLSLTELLLDSNDNTEMYNGIIQTIKKSSIMTWRHINIHGEYNFQNVDYGKVFEMERLNNFNLN